MTHFNLLDSLLNPPAAPVVESAVQAPEAPAPTETVEVDEAIMLRGSARGGSIPHALSVTYSHPNLPEPLYLTARATLDGDYSEDDRSFDYSYGSENGTHEDVADLIENLAWTNVTVPQIADNMDLFKLSQEQVAHVIKVVTHFVATMEPDAISQLVDMDKVTSLMKPDHSY